MLVYVDVDGTLISKTDAVRPYVVELLQGLKDLGCTIVVWSAGGANYASKKINMIDNRLRYVGNYDGDTLNSFVQNYEFKGEGVHRAVNLKRIGQTAFYIDDHEGLLGAMKFVGHGTFLVPFYTGSETDTWLLRALDAVRAAVKETVGADGSR